MPEIMDGVEAGFAALGRGEGEMPAKIGIHPREDCFIHAMPCHLGGKVDRAGIKCVSGYPPNPAKGLPYITGVMVLIDPDTGLPQAVMDAGWSRPGERARLRACTPATSATPTPSP